VLLTRQGKKGDKQGTRRGIGLPDAVIGCHGYTQQASALPGFSIVIVIERPSDIIFHLILVIVNPVKLVICFAIRVSLKDNFSRRRKSSHHATVSSVFSLFKA
jgi:hypothetical protein